MTVTVVGAGVSGLCCAVRLLEAGFGVRVVARELGEATTSALAGAVWFPYRVGPPERIGAWSAATYAALERLASEPDAAVGMVDLLVLGLEDPWWRAAVPEGRVRAATADELPAGYAGGHVARVPFVDAPRHLAWLHARVERLGGTVERGEVLSLADAAGGGIAVDCAGLGARALAGDAAVEPVQGHVVLVRPRAGARLRHAVDEAGPNGLAYVLPRPGLCVVGGTAVTGAWDTEPDPGTIAAILERAGRLQPDLEGAEVVRAAVGLRPARPAVRLEAEPLDGGGVVVHDYGHGGGGWTLAWGCADEVVALVASLRERGHEGQ